MNEYQKGDKFKIKAYNFHTKQTFLTECEVYKSFNLLNNRYLDVYVPYHGYVFTVRKEELYPNTEESSLLYE